MTLEETAPLPRARFLIVNGFTSFNLLLGIVALIAASAGQIALAAWALLACVLLDGCDGSLARRWNVSTEFGAQLDSLADMTSFIIAGVAVIYYWAQPTTPYWLIVGAAGLYALGGAIRLARFNATPQTPGYFEGIPTTFAAVAVAANYLVAPSLDAYWVVALVTLLALLMVSIFPYPKPNIGTVLRRQPWALLLLAAGVLFSPAWTVWLVTAGYIALGPAIWLYRQRAPKARIA